MIEIRKWTARRLEADRLKSISIFRDERVREPLQDYLTAFDEYREHVERLLEATSQLKQLDLVAFEVLTDPNLLEAFRYLAAPPISEDDLQVLAEAPSLARGRLQRSPQDVARLLDVVRLVLDRRRFVWVVEDRPPTESERHAAIVASAALMAASRVQTRRRNLGKQQQEELVIKTLRKMGLKETRARKIPTFTQAPDPGEFCRESSLAGRKADVVVRLWDHRIMPIECKVSNSYLNSVKRLNNDAAVKAGSWRRDLGIHQVVPVAVLAGVYKLASLTDAQDRDLSLVWSHNLVPLVSFIKKTKG